MDTHGTIDRILRLLNFDNEGRKSFSCREGMLFWDMDRMVKFMNMADADGNVALVYLAEICTRYLKDTSVNIYDLFSSPALLERERTLFDFTRSPEVNASLDMLARYVSAIIGRFGGSRLLGGDLRETIREAAVPVVEEFRKLRPEIYLKSPAPLDLRRVQASRRILKFSSLAECLLALEKAPDMLAVCFIEVAGTLDGWFGFFVKSNGSLFSVNERLDEAYIGQHGRLRNGRYVEDKALDLFPYDEMCKFSEERDYKGYSTSFVLDEGVLDMLDAEKVGPAVCARMFLAMAMLVQMYDGRTLDGEEVVVDSMLPQSMALLSGRDSQALVKWQESALVRRAANAIDVHFEPSRVLSGEYNAEFGMANVHQELVDAYGEGFAFDEESLLGSTSSLRLIGESEEPQEFIGSPDRLRRQAYWKLRSDLAAYLEKKMRQDYDSFGGYDALSKWYLEALRQKMPEALRLCALCDSLTELHGEGKGTRKTYMDEAAGIDVVEYVNGVRGHIDSSRYFNLSRYDKDRGAHVCPVSGCKATVCFSFRFRHHFKRFIEAFLGRPMPRFCAVWPYEEGYNGNCLLQATDMVGDVKPVIPTWFDGDFEVSLSRSGLKKLKGKITKEEKQE